MTDSPNYADVLMSRKEILALIDLLESDFNREGSTVFRNTLSSDEYDTLIENLKTYL